MDQVPSPVGSGIAVPSPEPAPVNVPGSDLAGVLRALAREGLPAQFLDVSGGRFKLSDKKVIDQKIGALHDKTRAKVIVVSLPNGVDVESYRPLYTDLKMSGRDLLVIFNGDRRHLHVQALTKKAGNEILKKTREQFYKNNIEGLEAMLDDVSTRLAEVQATAAAVRSGGNAGLQEGYGTLFVIGLVVFGVFAWSFVRRRQQSRNVARNLHDSVEAARRAIESARIALRSGGAGTQSSRVDELDRELDTVAKQPATGPNVMRARMIGSSAKKLARDAAAQRSGTEARAATE